MPAWLIPFLPYLIPPTSAAVLGGVVWGAGKLGIGGPWLIWIQAHTTSATLRKLEGIVIPKAVQAILWVDQVFADNLKSASSTGTLSPEDAQKAVAMAIQQVKDTVTPALLLQWAQAQGATSPDSVLPPLVEALVKLKNEAVDPTTSAIDPTKLAAAVTAFAGGK